MTSFITANANDLRISQQLTVHQSPSPLCTSRLPVEGISVCNLLEEDEDKDEEEKEEEEKRDNKAPGQSIGKLQWDVEDGVQLQLRAFQVLTLKMHFAAVGPGNQHSR